MGSPALPDAVRRDPIFWLARSGWWRRFFIVAVAVVSAILLIVPELGSPLPHRPTDLQFVGRAVWALAGVPVGLFLYFWVPIAVSTLIPDLVNNRVLADPDDAEGTLERSADEIARWMDSLWLPVAGVTIVDLSLAFILIFLPPEARPSVWELAVVIVAGYTGTVMVFRLVAGTIATGQAIHRAKSRVIPLHVDEAGGWGGIGSRFFVLARAGLVYGLVAIVVNLGTITAGQLPTTPVALLTFFLFLFLPPLVVAAWFFAPHRAMLEARAEVLEPISRAAEDARLAGHQVADGQDPAVLVRAGSDWLAELVRRHDLIVATHPAWPLRLVELRAVWATAFAPIVTTLVATVAGLVGDWLRRTPPG